MIQLLEATITGVIAIALASLWFADRVLKRDALDVLPPPTSAKAIKEKRRILERDRDEWLRGSGPGIAREVSKVDAKLLALADEEARLDHQPDFTFDEETARGMANAAGSPPLGAQQAGVKKS